MNKAKVKTEKKANKAKAKIAKKCAKTRKVCAALAILLVLAGCQQVPSRSQTLTVRDCTITIYGGGSDTNNLATVEIGTQAMSIENSGTESFTPTQTTDTKPDIDVTVGGKATGGGLLESVTSRLLGNSDSAAATASASTSCEGGNCSE